MEKPNIPANKTESFFQLAGQEFQLNPAPHNRMLLIELKKLQALEDIRSLLIDIKGKIKSTA